MCWGCLQNERLFVSTHVSCMLYISKMREFFVSVTQKKFGFWRQKESLKHFFQPLEKPISGDVEAVKNISSILWYSPFNSTLEKLLFPYLNIILNRVIVIFGSPSQKRPTSGKNEHSDRVKMNTTRNSKSNFFSRRDPC